MMFDLCFPAGSTMCKTTYMGHISKLEKMSNVVLYVRLLFLKKNLWSYDHTAEVKTMKPHDEQTLTPQVATS